MSTLDQYINELKDLEQNLDKYIGKIILDNQGKILSMIKLRLFNTGKDAKNNLIQPYYHPSTVIQKKNKGQRASHVTLRDVGDFYASMFLTYKEDELFVSSTDPKSSQLIERYGEDILGLTEKEQNILIDSILEPELQKLINNIGTQIELEF